MLVQSPPETDPETLFPHKGLFSSLCHQIFLFLPSLLLTLIVDGLLKTPSFLECTEGEFTNENMQEGNAPITLIEINNSLPILTIIKS